MNYFTRNKWWAIAFLLLIALNIATLATFWLLKEKNAAPRFDPKQGTADFLVKELGFDSVQKQKLQQLREEHQKQMMDVRKGNREVKDAFFDLLNQPNIADSTVEREVKTSFMYDERAEVLTFRHFQHIRNLCTEEQKKKFDAIIKEVLRMMAPPPPQSGGPQGPPPGMGDGQPPPGDGKRPPPPQQ